jgi:hypothetical protein
VAYLASPEAQYVTGASFTIDGGVNVEGRGPYCMYLTSQRYVLYSPTKNGWRAGAKS